MTELARGFPAFPRGRRRDRQFARTWWGRAWVKALEDTALDEAQLVQGRKYAYTGYVGAITVSPSRIAASVHDYEDNVAYQTSVYFGQLTDAEWERFLDQVAAQAGHIAALLDRDMPHELVEAAEDAGVRLLPDIGDLDPECDCPGWEHPCKHAAALAYQTSWLLDADPFVLLLIRGRGERELLGELQRRNVRQSEIRVEAADVPETRGIPAREAYARETAPLPEPPPVPERAEWRLSVSPGPGADPDALRLLVADAAGRARELLADPDAEPVGPLEMWPDTVRWAATHPEPALVERLRRASGRDADQFARATRAWSYGRATGLAVLESMWTPTSSDVARARTAIATAWDEERPPELSVERNRWTVTGRGLQLRQGRDGRWYPYREEAGEWWPAGPPNRDPAAVLAQLIAG